MSRRYFSATATNQLVISTRNSVFFPLERDTTGKTGNCLYYFFTQRPENFRQRILRDGDTRATSTAPAHHTHYYTVADLSGRSARPLPHHRTRRRRAAVAAPPWWGEPNSAERSRTPSSDADDRAARERLGFAKYFVPLLNRRRERLVNAAASMHRGSMTCR